MAPSEAGNADRRERLARLLAPRSIAVIGGKAAGLAIDQCRSLGFSGDIWPIHPTRSELRGIPTSASVHDLPAAPDAAFVAVNRHLTIGVVAALREIGCGVAVCYSSGFAEAGAEGMALEAELVSAAGCMPVVGPNCYGTLSASVGAALWPDQQGLTPTKRGIAVVTQSGNIAMNLTMQARGLEIVQVLTLGNQCDVSLEDCLDVLVDDPGITAVALHVEALHDIDRFTDSVGRAQERGIPVVVLKTGASERGASIAVSHTASLVGDDAAYTALFERLGVRRVHTIPELLDTVHTLDTIGPLPGARIVSLSCSGGEAALVADRAPLHDLEFEPFTDEHASRIRATLNELVAITNPLDYHTFIWGNENELTTCFTEALTGPVDAAMLVLDFPKAGLDHTNWWPTLKAFAAASRASGTPAVVTASLPENLPPAARDAALELGLAALTDIDSTLRCLDAAAWLGRHRPAKPMMPPALPSPQHVLSIGERDAKNRLEEAGIGVPRREITHRANAASAATTIGFPVVMKATGLDHKSDVGGVLTDITDASHAASAAAEMTLLSDELLIEEQIQGGVELVVTVRRSDPIGYLLTVGAGGTLVEVLNDTRSLLLPAARTDVRHALQQLRIGHLLRGHRGGQPLAIDSVLDVIDALTRMVSIDPGIVEIEINPLIVGAHRAVAVDALIMEATRG